MFFSFSISSKLGPLRGKFYSTLVQNVHIFFKGQPCNLEVYTIPAASVKSWAEKKLVLQS